MVLELASGDLPDWGWDWSMGSIQDPRYGGIDTRAARTRAKCAFLTSYDKNPLRLDLSKRFQTEKNRDLDSFRRTKET